MSCRADLLDAIEDAWQAFECASAPPRVDPSIPILFFGDLKAYCESDLRVVTVELNPSRWEFPKFPDTSPFCRFPLADGIATDEHDLYLDALSAYFRVIPNMGWFSAFEPMLCGMGASYYGNRASTALHTDICSPVPTDPTWRKLKQAERDILMEKGVPLWNKLLEALCPNVVVISVAESHLSKVKFEALCDKGWKMAHVFDKTREGKSHKQPVKMKVCWYEVCGEPSLFVFIRAGQRPLFLSDEQKCEAGAIALREWQQRAFCC